MRKIFLIIFFSFLSASAFAEFGRSTTFDDREFCEKDKGVWREFGNSLADSCEAKFDKFAIAAQALTYACDCGKGRCWDDTKCVVTIDFKKTYDQKQAEMQKKLDAAKRARREEYRENFNERLPALANSVTAPPPATADNQNNSAANVNAAANNNFDQFRDKFLPDGGGLLNTNVTSDGVTNVVTQQTQTMMDRGSEAMKQVEQGPIGRFFTTPLPSNNTAPAVPTPANTITPVVPVVTNSPDQIIAVPATPAVPAVQVPAANTNSAGPTPFFLQQLENAKKDAAKNNATTNAAPAIIINPPASSTEVGLPELPQISIPQ